ncbi:PVC-type heme-binding CxxCH protein [Thalassoroseus pseudoceratinae]|uniref:PVC-type heme-binding CxxCH protein n=1 Tax=Thalassoroseus pseudoceratinae TaxID=2713176 RepID=UPI00141F7E7A|nr:PVC-type heme-binding CxxCH protein [Thalassoroseus pseudoceratinae]
MRYMIFALLCCLPSAAVWGQRDLKVIPPTDPEIERKSFVLPEGFEVNLFAADPAIAKPIQMNFDDRGRLWLATSEVYPHIKPGQEANDKILILEDADGDGVSDKTTVFADGLLIPTGVAPGHGGAFVANSTELLHLRDTDGDGKADDRRVVLSGFGTEDTHHILHTFRWGPDGCLYVNQSIYIHSHIETPYGVKRLNGGGIWKFRPETMELDVFARGWINAWGHEFDSLGNSFVTDGAGGQGINYVVPGAAYATAVGVPRILPGLNPGSPKYCGLEVVGGSHLPDDWQGDLITHDFRGHRVCRFKVSNDGSGFASQQMPDLIRSSHTAFRPVDVRLGPDGAIYIADWYNPIIQHGEVDFRDSRRDQTHGRIWRITYKGRPTTERPDFAKLSVDDVLSFLKSDQPWHRRHAKLALRERQVDITSNLKAFVSNLDASNPEYDRHRLEAIWTGQTCGVIDVPLLVSLMQAKTSGVRAAAARIAGDWIELDQQIPQHLAKLASDTDSHVRLEAARAFAKWSDQTQAVQSALAARSNSMDQWLDYALWLTCRETADGWLPKLQAGEFNFDGKADDLAFALRAIRNPAAVSSLTKLLNQGDVSDAQRETVLNVLAELGQPNDLNVVWDAVREESTTETRRQELLTLLARAARERKVKPSGDLSAAVKWLNDSDAKTKLAIVNCVAAWKLSSARDELRLLALADDTDAELRTASLSALTALGNANDVLMKLVQSDRSWPVRRQGVIALTKTAPQKAATAAVGLLQSAPTPEATAALFVAFLERKNGPAALTAALDQHKLPADVARIGLRTIDSTATPHAKLTEQLAKAGGITSGPKQLSADEMQTLLTRVTDAGDATRGETVFRRESLACMTCHAIAGAGGKVGPDLISLGGSAQPDYIVESLLDPNKKIKENYHSLVVATDEGQILTGVKVRQTDTELLLRDAKDQLISIPLASILQQKVGKSLMPAGLTEKLTQTEFVDLIAFLSGLGKAGSSSVSQTPVARRWEVMQATTEAKHQLRRTSYDAAANNPDAFAWKPVYSRVNGDLPIADLPVMNQLRGPRSGEPVVAFARTELDVTTEGEVVLRLNSPNGLRIWLDSKPLEPAESMTVPLKTGRHWLTVAVLTEHRKKPVRLELQPATDSKAQAKFIAGK